MATFRFYATLNEFLPPARRQREFTCRCAQGATVKHMIEALGVPHTEVELALVNGEPAGFERRLREDDRLAVYPRFESLDVTPPPQIRTQPPPQAMRFVADAHLGGLARLLRMAGFDTLYDNHFPDSEIAAVAVREGRIVLTRDRELLKWREIARGCYVHALKPPAQLQEIVQRLDLAARFKPFTLCLNCNAPLHALEPALALPRVPPAVRVQHTRFSTCAVCQRIYWEGSHWRRMHALLARVAAPQV